MQVDAVDFRRQCAIKRVRPWAPELMPVAVVDDVVAEGGFLGDHAADGLAVAESTEPVVVSNFS